MTNTTQVSNARKWVPGAYGPFSMLAGAILAVLFAHSLLARYLGEQQTMTTETQFYCNVKAMNPAERAAHKELTDRMIHARRKITETPDGYEFQLDASAISLPDLANWVVSEAKCCPFFDFHLNLEDQGRALALRLTGPKGVKPFLRVAFTIPAK